VGVVRAEADRPAAARRPLRPRLITHNPCRPPQVRRSTWPIHSTSSPAPGPEQVLMRIDASRLCRTDIVALPWQLAITDT